LSEPIAKLRVEVKPGARRSQVIVFADGALRVHVAAPPVAGRANHELVERLSDWLDIPQSAVTIEHGASGRSKLIAIAGLTDAQLAERLSRRHGD